MTSAPGTEARRAAERWFLDHGLPSVITQRARLRYVWSRSAPALSGYAIVALCPLAIFLLTGTTTVNIDGRPNTVEWIVLALIVVALPLAVLVGWLVARFAGRRVQGAVSAAVVLIGLGSAVMQRDPAPMIGTAIAVAAALFLSASGLGSVLGWALRMTLSQIAAVGELLIGALPVVLLTVLVFFNTYVWVMASTIGRPRLWLAIVFLASIACAFVVSGLLERAGPSLDSATASPRHAQDLQGTPFADMPDPPHVDPLNRAERLNVVFVLAVSQLAQIVMVAVVTAAIFFILGLILLNPGLLAAWTRNGASDGTVLGMTIPVPEALINMTLFLAGLTFMYVSARAVGDGEYRAKFLDPLIDDLKSTLLARNRYRASSPASGLK